MYLGNQPALSYTSFAKQDFTTSATTSYTLDNPVTNENELALFINFVRQEPTTAYTASGTSLTLTSATSSSDDMYCVYLGKAVQTVNPPNGSVGISQLSATGTKDSTTFLRGDNTFASAGGTNTPAFEAYGSSHMTGVADDVFVKLIMNTEKFDTDSMYDSSTNYRFTPTIAGKYYVYGMCDIYSETNYSLNVANIAIKKNGSFYKIMNNTYDASYEPNENTLFLGAVVDFNGSSDYVELFARSNVTSGTSTLDIDESSGTFGAYKLIGV